MFSKILVPVDGSELAGHALWQVPRILSDDPSAVVILIHAVDPQAGSELDEEAGLDAARHLSSRVESAERRLEELISLWRRYLGARRIDLRRSVVVGDPTEVVLKAVAREAPDLVVLATHGRGGPGRWVRGSVAERLLRRCPAPLLLCSPRALARREYAFKKILAPLDGSNRAAQVLDLVIPVAAAHTSRVTLLRVCETPPERSERRDPKTLKELRASLEPHRQHLEAAGIDAEVEVELAGNVAGAITDYAEQQGMDLVALTTHGASGRRGWLFGAVAEKVLRHCPAPLLVKRVAGFLPARKAEP